MQTKLTTLCIVSLLLTGCGKKEDHPTAASGNDGSPRGARGGILLTTELPPELIEGTPRPIILPLHTPISGAQPQSIRVRPDVESPPLARKARLGENPDGFLTPASQPPPVDRERYGVLIDNPWQTPVDAPLSTFSVDVDTASYANVRSMILDGRSIPSDAVRLEEMVNYFDYTYPQPTDNHPFAVHVDNATCPWNPQHQLVRVALKGLEIKRAERPPANLVFLLDVSGSMNDARKLPLVTASLQLLLEELNASDTLSIVVYAGAEGLALPPTACHTQGGFLQRQDRCG